MINGDTEVKKFHIVKDLDEKLNVIHIKEDLSIDELRALVVEFKTINKADLNEKYLVNRFVEFLNNKSFNAKDVVLGATIDLHM
ncbi:hypothetical protein P5G65_25155 [Paenibacillus chondroitinus]|uniref:Uncharacterized protein n=1 Tax=Paenibacillus chondroitinus TaxID=59842 RepID=A0ABU6DHG8_9BACL|nr:MULTISPECIES: hypothetical protein [Paenibacillus]MCY9658486.1 hypothetical protein [Paenibacillus anseongense]MEB4797198.1 hypothetical protein [Paenibacillus chondroitinus]